MYNNSVYYPYPLHGVPTVYAPSKNVQTKGIPGCLAYYEGCSYKPAPQMYDPANWLIQPPIKKYVKKVKKSYASCKPSCIGRCGYFIDLNLKKY
jgi:hypothetical protein